MEDFEYISCSNFGMFKRPLSESDLQQKVRILEEQVAIFSKELDELAIVLYSNNLLPSHWPLGILTSLEDLRKK